MSPSEIHDDEVLNLLHQQLVGYDHLQFNLTKQKLSDQDRRVLAIAVRKLMEKSRV